MPKIFLSLIIFAFQQISVAQYLHTPKEMERIMLQSNLNYDLDSSLSRTQLPAFPVLKNVWIARNSATGMELIKSPRSFSKKYEKAFDKGIKAFDRGRYNEAIDQCQKALLYESDRPACYKCIGRSYLAKKDFVMAAHWLNEAIEFNFIDFEAHRLLAEAYDAQRAFGKAVRHITLAHLYNRNQMEILDELKAIYRRSGLEYNSWEFRPIFFVSKDVEDRVTVYYKNGPWKAYANCKAVWMFEPGYREKMQELADVDNRIIEEKECLLNALISYEQLEQDKTEFPELAFLSLSLSRQMVDDYIVYEILSRANPLLVSKLSIEKVDRLAEYVLTVRTNKLKN